MAATLKDIANKAGVTVATVSLALNNKRGVSREKMLEIRKIAEELGYTRIPEPDISGLTIDFVHIVKPNQSWDDNYKLFIAEYLEGITASALQSKIQLDVKTFETTDVRQVKETLEKTEAGGIIFLGAGLYPEDIQVLSEIGTEHIFIDVNYPGLNETFVDMDNEESVHQIISYLKGAGHKTIGMISSRDKSPNFRYREAAFWDAISANGLVSGAQWFIETDVDQSVGKEQIKNSLTSLDKRPDAIFCVNDMIAYSCLHACAELGLEVPGDLAVIGFDNLPASKIMKPHLTTFAVSKAFIARKALSMLIDRIKSPEEHISRRVLVGGKLIVRESA